MSPGAIPLRSWGTLPFGLVGEQTATDTAGGGSSLDGGRGSGICETMVTDVSRV
jgi:hypothetical protein